MNRSSLLVVGPFLAASLCAATGCALNSSGPSDDSAADVSTDDLKKISCSKALATELQRVFDEGDDASLVSVRTADLPWAARAKLKTLNAQRRADGVDLAEPFKYTSATGSAFVFYFNGGDDGDVVIEAYTASGAHVISGSAPCSCEPIDWVDVCAAPSK